MDRVEAAVLGARSAPARGKLVAARHDQHVWETTADPTTSMLRDVADALRRWPLWVRLGWQDVLLRYRRSLLGPFWLTLSMGIMIVTLGSIYGQFQHLSTTQYMPFLATGLMAWTLISALVTEGCQSFIAPDCMPRQITRPRRL